MAEYSYNFQDKELSPKTTQQDIEENWLWALVGYLGPLFLVVLAIKRDSAFAVYHARQGMGLFIAFIIWLVIEIITNFIVPAGIRFVFLAVTTIFVAGFLGLLVLWIAGIINVYQGKMKPVDMIGKYFEADNP